MNCKPGCHCPNCDSEMRALMTMSPQDYSAWLTITQREVARDLGAQRVLRAGVQSKPVRALAEPPDGYAIALKKRRDGGTPKPVKTQPGEAPDPYAIALAKKRREGGAR